MKVVLTLSPYEGSSPCTTEPQTFPTNIKPTRARELSVRSLQTTLLPRVLILPDPVIGSGRGTVEETRRRVPT